MNMYLKTAIMVLFVGSILTACAMARPTAVPPLRDADLYPNSQSVAGFTIAVDEISDPDRARMYFGVDLTSDEILPVNIVVTNRSEDPFLVKPTDALLLRGDSVVDTVPLEMLDAGMKGRMAELGFRETTVAPGKTYQGILLFKTNVREPGLYGKVEKVFSDKLSLRVAATDLATGDRILFGPFPVAGL